jgi:hypothetical protein
MDDMSLIERILAGLCGKIATEFANIEFVDEGRAASGQRSGARAAKRRAVHRDVAVSRLTADDGKYRRANLVPNDDESCGNTAVQSALCKIVRRHQTSGNLAPIVPQP